MRYNPHVTWDGLQTSYLQHDFQRGQLSRRFDRESASQLSEISIGDEKGPTSLQGLKPRRAYQDDMAVIAEVRQDRDSHIIDGGIGIPKRSVCCGFSCRRRNVLDFGNSRHTGLRHKAKIQAILKKLSPGGDPWTTQ